MRGVCSFKYPFWCTKVAVLTGDAAAAAHVVAGPGTGPTSQSLLLNLAAATFGWLRAVELRFDGTVRLVRWLYVRIIYMH